MISFFNQSFNIKKLCFHSHDETHATQEQNKELTIHKIVLLPLNSLQKRKEREKQNEIFDVDLA